MILIWGNTQNYQALYVIKKNIFSLCMYQTYLISAEGYKNADVEFRTIKTTIEILVSMKDLANSIGVKNMSDLVLKEIYGICETKDPSKEHVNEYRMTKTEIYKKFTNLSKQELNKRNNRKA